MTQHTLRPGPAWRVAPMGSTEVFVNGTAGPDHYSICSRGAVSRWAKKPMTVPRADVFATRPEALAEFRFRRDAAHRAAEVTQGSDAP